ncbi:MULTISPECIES: trans-aconitate 2-methyltransferase [unclassified Microbacterium]|uniref:class I SAM-dependent methyltransferase n=1 Tax=unclassified Microbacterium TaxID=2609290 RepID=UPI001FCE9915|nr:MULTISPECIES: class I SAM-dependent methyltransferase [unclassified Microbacterium]
MSAGTRTDRRVRDGYTARADEYTALFGDVGQLDARDRERIAGWADGIDGPILDAGCGPGQWTAYLADRGREAEGIDLVPAFVATASARFPHVSYRVASLLDPGVRPGSVGVSSPGTR